jgi:hypothetical protein
MTGGDRAPNTERHREGSDASIIFTATRHSDEDGCGCGNVRTLLIDAETGVGGLLATCAADLPVARFRPDATSARMRGQTSVLYCSGPDRDRFRSWKRAAMPWAHAHDDVQAVGSRVRSTVRRSRVRVPLAIIYADERTYASKFATKFDESFPLDL